MASTQTIVRTKSEYGIGIGYESYTLVWGGGTTSGTIIPSAASGIREIWEFGVTNLANANAVKVVKSYSSSSDKDILTLTGTANDSFDVWVKGPSRGA